MSRFPYTYAADYIRSIAGYNEQGTKLSRADVSQILQHIANILGMEKEELAEKIAYQELEKTDEDYGRQLNEFLKATGPKED